MVEILNKLELMNIQNHVLQLMKQVLQTLFVQFNLVLLIPPYWAYKV